MKKIKNPFSNLGKDEKGGGNIDKRPTQGKRLTGKTLLAKAMGKISKKK